MAVPARQLPAAWEPEVDPFRYGWRPRYVQRSGCELIEEWIPLTADDLLDPQLGDVVVQGGPHFNLMIPLSDLLRRHFAPRKDVYVAGDMKMLWGLPGVQEPAPDIAVIFGVPRDLERSSFDAVEEGARPSLILELVSSIDAATRRNDYEKKVVIYESVGIPEYVIVDPPTRATRGRLLLTGYRLGADGRYRPLAPDGAGRLLSETTQLLFGVDADGVSLVVIDGRTGQRLQTSSEMEAALEASEAALEAAEKRADREAEARRVLEAELARLRSRLNPQP
jgi:Uma2 family endonuclease